MQARETAMRTGLCMGTVVGVQLVSEQPASGVEEALDRVFRVFRRVEQICTRFDRTSELMQLCATVGRPVPVSPTLFEAVRFAMEIARATNGVFDPAVGQAMVNLGFQRNYLTGEVAALRPDANSTAMFRDIEVNETNRTIQLNRPMLLDLGAVAKGLAVDLAVQELAPFAGFLINAGGDVYVSGENEAGQPWEVGIQHPLQPDALFCTLRLTNAAVCTSGGYERKSPLHHGTHHIIDPQSHTSPKEVLSCTTVAPFAMMADAVSTAAFLLGPVQGLNFLRDCGAEGLLIAEGLTTYQTDGMEMYLHGNTP